MYKDTAHLGFPIVSGMATYSFEMRVYTPPIHRIVVLRVAF